MAEDERTVFLVNSISAICEVRDRRNLASKVETSKDVRTFLDDTRYERKSVSSLRFCFCT